MQLHRSIARSRLLLPGGPGNPVLFVVLCGLLCLTPPVGLTQEAAPSATEQQPSSEQQLSLARYLKAVGFRYYGAWWCGFCSQQAILFGPEAKKELPYVECDKPDEQPEAAAACRALGVRAFPTWMYGNDKREGVLSLEELSRWSGYQTPANPETAPEVTSP